MEHGGPYRSLGRKRTHLYKLIDAVEERDRERDRLVTQLEAGGSFETGLDFALGTVGLAPAVQPAEPASPFEDDVLVRDLLVRDPRAARRILFEADPATYWQRFPLRPPARALSQALVFPLADLPGRR